MLSEVCQTKTNATWYHYMENLTQPVNHLTEENSTAGGVGVGRCWAKGTELQLCRMNKSRDKTFQSHDSI